jgi:CRISPR-associated protein Csm1
MNDDERLIIAALLHDLARLLAAADLPVPEPARRVLGLAHLHDAALDEVLRDACTYAAPAHPDTPPLTRQPLRAIFSRIQRQPETEPPQVFYPFSPLQAADRSQDYLFPMARIDETRWQSHIEAFLADLAWLGATVDIQRFDHLYPHLLTLLQRYGWCLPLSQSDISLYDQARLTSAVAACLARWYAVFPRHTDPMVRIASEPFCLVVGDLSGIQTYIFGITTVGAGGIARRLRARSFQISLLADSISHLVAFRCGVPLGNVLMASGGKFYVLVPQLDDTMTALHALRQEIDHWLHAQFNYEVSIDMAVTCVRGEQLRPSTTGQPGFAAVMANLAAQLQREERRRGHQMLAQDGNWDESAFVVRHDFWGSGACSSCGKFPGQPPDGVCERCAQDVQLGKLLPRMRYVAFYQTAAHADALAMPAGYAARVLAADELADAGDPYLLVKLNDPDIRDLATYPGSFRYLATHIPIGDDQAPLAFDELAATATGRSLLGYIKADVDYLGILFSQGLRRDAGENYDTAAHVAALSRELDLFFSGWMQHMLSRASAYRHFYTIFSGGDDLFLVGPWDQATDLATAIRRSFSAFVGHNPDITFSASILFAKERYPVSRAATDAETLLEHSKERPWSDNPQRRRDQVTILNTTLRWNTVPVIMQEVDTVRESLDQMTSALLYDLVEYGRLYRLWTDHQQVEGLRYKALFAYTIARNLRRGDKALYRWADGILQTMHGNEEHFTMRYLGLIATYLLFLKRNTET